MARRKYSNLNVEGEIRGAERGKREGRSAECEECLVLRGKRRRQEVRMVSNNKPRGLWKVFLQGHQEISAWICLNVVLFLSHSRLLNKRHWPGCLAAACKYITPTAAMQMTCHVPSSHVGRPSFITRRPNALISAARSNRLKIRPGRCLPAIIIYC